MNYSKSDLSISTDKKAVSRNLNDSGFISVLRFVAWGYLVLSMIGAILLLKEKLVVYGISAIITAIIVYSALYGIARIIEQNNHILHMLNDTEQE